MFQSTLCAEEGRSLSQYPILLLQRVYLLTLYQKATSINPINPQ